MELGMYDYSLAKPIAEAALSYRSLRQDLISSNIANVNTPMYRPKDVAFEEILAKQAKEIFGGNNSLELKQAKTDQFHMEGFIDDNDMASVYYRDGHMARNDGNSVDLDIETSEMSKNGVMYNAIIEALKKQGNIFKYALQASSSL